MAGAEPSITTGMRQADSCVFDGQRVFYRDDGRDRVTPPSCFGARTRRVAKAFGYRLGRPPTLQARTADAFHTHYERRLSHFSINTVVGNAEETRWFQPGYLLVFFLYTSIHMYSTHVCTHG